MICQTHRAVIAGLYDLYRRGIISDTDRALATQMTESDCVYVAKEQDANGDCVLRHP